LLIIRDEILAERYKIQEKNKMKEVIDEAIKPIWIERRLSE